MELDLVEAPSKHWPQLLLLPSSFSSHSFYAIIRGIGGVGVRSAWRFGWGPS